MDNSTAWGIGLATITLDGTTLDTWYPAPHLGEAGTDEELATSLSVLERVDDARRVRTVVVTTTIDLQEAPASTEDAYLRLHLLSHRLVQPNTINLDGIFAVLPNVVWTDAGPCAVADFEATRLRLRARDGHPVTVQGVDKFPPMVNYVLPSGVRIADGTRVRLGAYLSEGTTVMHAGFVNFNAGTLGRSMVEGRVSQGVVIGDGSDGRRRLHDGHPLGRRQAARAPGRALPAGRELGPGHRARRRLCGRGWPVRDRRCEGDAHRFFR